MFAIRRVLPFSTSLYTLQIPLTGLPWYGFLRLSRRDRKPAPREIVAAIAGGGAVTSFLVGLTYPILLPLLPWK